MLGARSRQKLVFSSIRGQATSPPAWSEARFAYGQTIGRSTVDLSQMINDSMFEFLYKRSFLPSLYVKPTRFSVEQELRLVFEMPNGGQAALPGGAAVVYARGRTRFAFVFNRHGSRFFMCGSTGASSCFSDAVKSSHSACLLLVRARLATRPVPSSVIKSRRFIVHSITSSARASSMGGIVRPSALAVIRLISSYLVGACTGRSAGFSPLRM